MKLIPIHKLLFFICILASCGYRIEAQSAPKSTWVSSSCTYKNNSRNLQWTLPDYSTWRLAEEDRLPKHTQFCAAMDEYSIVVAFLCIPLGENNKCQSIKNASADFLQGMISSIKKQAPIFPGIKYGSPIIEEVKYLYKDALKITLYAEIIDERIVPDTAVPFAFRMIVFIKGSEAILIEVMIPQIIVDECGNEVFSDFTNGLKYIDATKEIH